ncbi:hypothetical protein BDQ17DRAFT_880831 [Cyathus striatus]|nr:hypothetical protein BDQ17DRAFT_880831 [Cyathus striatus]
MFSPLLLLIFSTCRSLLRWQPPDVHKLDVLAAPAFSLLSTLLIVQPPPTNTHRPRRPNHAEPVADAQGCLQPADTTALQGGVTVSHLGFKYPTTPATCGTMIGCTATIIKIAIRMIDVGMVVVVVVKEVMGGITRGMVGGEIVIGSISWWS